MAPSGSSSLAVPNSYSLSLCSAGGSGMASLQERLERSVDRSGEHHVWLGALNEVRGTGRLKVGGRNTTAHRIAWEIAHGPLGPGRRVLPCPDDPRCVRMDELHVEHAS